MPNASIPTLYPEAKTPIQSHLFALADLAAKELDGIRVPGVSPLACAPRHKAIGMLDYLSTQHKEPPLPVILKDRLAEVFIDTTLSPRSDMDYLLCLRGLSVINPTGPQCLSVSDLTCVVKNMIRECRLNDIELGIFASPVHAQVCDFLIKYQRDTTEQTSKKIDLTLRSYLDLWPNVPRSTPEGALHAVFFPIVESDLAAIRHTCSLAPLKPPRGW